MISALIPLIGLMICGAIIALETKDLLSGVISLGIIGFALTIIFLILQAPDLAIVQIIIETLTLIILIAAVLKTTRKDTIENIKVRKVILWICGFVCVAAFVFARLLRIVIKSVVGAIAFFISDPNTISPTLFLSCIALNASATPAFFAVPSFLPFILPDASRP